MNEMKWYIFNEDGNPLCWEDQAIYFESKSAAYRFLETCKSIYLDFETILPSNAIVENILYYDGGYINYENKTVILDETGEDILVALN